MAQFGKSGTTILTVTAMVLVQLEQTVEPVHCGTKDEPDACADDKDDAE